MVILRDNISIRNVLVLEQFALNDPYTTYLLKTATIYLEINIHCLHMVCLIYVYYLLTGNTSLYILWPYLLKAAIQS